MFRLIKLAFYALAGYSLYQFYLGMTGGRRTASLPGRLRDLDRALSNEDEGRMGTLTGSGVGEREETLDAWGTVIPHRVGRGVTRS